MSLDPVLVVSAAALSLGMLSFASHWRSRVARRRDRAELESAIEVATEKQKAEAARTCSEMCAAMQTELKQGFDALEQFVLSPSEPPRAGSLNRSARSQALQLLRSGMSPETAASTLGMGRREIRLLDRVAQTFSPR